LSPRSAGLGVLGDDTYTAPRSGRGGGRTLPPAYPLAHCFGCAPRPSRAPGRADRRSPSSSSRPSHRIFHFFLRAPLVTGSGPSPPLVPGPLRIPARFQGSGVARRFSFPKEDLPGAYPWRTCSGPSRLLVLLAGSSRSGPPGAAPLWVASRPVPAAASPPPLPRVRARHSPLSVAPRVRGLVPRPGRGRRFAAVAHAGPSSALSSERRSSRTGPRAPSWPPLRRRRLRGSELAGGALRLL